MEKFDHRTSFLKSVERTLDVIEILSKNFLIGVTELANSMKISTSTAHRILATLKAKGFAIQDSDTGKYTVGYKILQLGISVIHIMKPLKYIQSCLDELCSKTGENVIFGVVTPSKDRIFVLAEKVTDKAVIVKPMIYQYFPLHICPCGKEYLLTLNDKQIKVILSKTSMVPFAEYTRTSFPSFKKQLAKFRKLGYSVSRDELVAGISAISSGIRGADNEFVGAIAIVGPTSRFTNKNIECWRKILTRSTKKSSLEFKTKGIKFFSY